MAPSITSVTGTLTHGATWTIAGADFGSKSTAAPYIWDDCSGTDPTDLWDFAYPYNNPASWQINYRTPAQVTTESGTGVALPHSNITKYLCGAHYNTSTPDAHSGLNVCIGKNSQQLNTKTFISYWTRIDPNWHFITGDHNYKEYDYAAGAGYTGDGYNSYFDNKYINNSTVNWGANYVEGMDVTIDHVNESFMTWYPETDGVFSTVDCASPLNGWHKIEMELAHNTPAGSHKIWQDGVLAWEVYLDDDGGVSPSGRSETVVGGFCREAGTSNAYKNNWRYYADVYYDHSWARICIGNASTYAASTSREYQIPETWSATSVTITSNFGALTDPSSKYLFILDDSGTASPGFLLSGITPNYIWGIRNA